MRDPLQQIFVTADDPAYLEDELESHVETLDLNALDMRDLHAKITEWRGNFDTSPFDPEGHKLKFYPGGVTIWSGFPGAGKTTLLRQLACHLVHRGRHVFVASLEELAWQVFYEHTRTALAMDAPTPNGLQWCADVWADKLRISGDEAYAEPAKLLALIRVLARKHGVRHAIIDSLMCLEVDSRDIEQQRQFSNLLALTARSTGVHIHLVAHPRKLISAHQEPDINDVAGSADLGRKAHNVVFVRRAKDDSVMPTLSASPMVISIRKQRYGGAIGDIGGWFDRSWLQYKPNQFDGAPQRYLPDAVYRDEWPNFQEGMAL